MKRFSYVLLFMLTLGLFLPACNGDLDQLRSNGQMTSATVLSKRETSALKAKNRHYSLGVGFFAQDSAEIAKGAHQDDVLKDTTMSMADRINNWQPGSAIGEYTTVDIDVSKPIYDKYKDGDKVDVVYLPSDPKIVRLKEQL
ncbi:MAG: hypothetical protein IPN95_00420 [Bacteroidetes bacterium]|nr:hypothetical protein [Bacteroidota bacterium]MBL0017862.1 hypothetical protein [Bacteroidota bacterium]